MANNDARARPARGQSLAVNLLLGLGVTLLLAAAAEGAARLLARPPVERARVADYIWDWERMWDGDFYTVGSASVGWPPWEEFNGDGLRDRTHAEEKPPRTQRLAFLGDSVTFGDALEPAQAYPQALQRRLDESGRRVEVFNAALWGWSTRQERIAYERLLRRYRLDSVVLAVCLNDIPELQNNLARPPAWLSLLHRRSALARVVLDAQGREIRSVEELFTRREVRRVREGFARFFDEVGALRAVVEGDGAAFALLVFPFRFQLEAGAPEPSVQAHISDYCGAQGLTCVDLLPVLARLGPRSFRDYDHLSAEGAQLVADYLAESALVPRGTNLAEAAGELVAGQPGERRAARLRAVLASTAATATQREAAAWALGRGGLGAAPPGGPSAGSSGVAADQAAAAGAGGSATSEVLAATALRRALRSDSDAGVRAAAARALGERPGAVRAALVDLVAALEDRSQTVRFAAAQALAAQPPRAEDGAVGLLAPAAASGDPYVRGFAVWSLGNLGEHAAQAVPALIQALRDEQRIPGVAAQALAKVGPRAAAAAPALVDTLAVPDARRRWNAAIALGRIGLGGAAVVAPLRVRLGDEDARVRAAAAQALGRLRAADAETVARLAAALEDGSAGVRAQAARALGWLGTAAVPAVARLNACLRDDDERVRREAHKALRRIQEGSATEPEGSE